jgi:hypothetical protein
VRKASFSSNATVAIFGFVKKVSAPAIWDSLSSLIVVATPATPHASSHTCSHSSKGDARSFWHTTAVRSCLLGPAIEAHGRRNRRVDSTGT